VPLAAERGLKVLLVDTDSQGNVGVSLNVKTERSLYHVLVMGLKAQDAAKAGATVAASGTGADEVVDAEIVDDTPELDPEDPWATAITGLADDDTEGAISLLDDASEQLVAGDIDAERFSQIETAVLKRFPGAQNAPAVEAA